MFFRHVSIQLTFATVRYGYSMSTGYTGLAVHSQSDAHCSPMSRRRNRKAIKSSDGYVQFHQFPDSQSRPRRPLASSGRCFSNFAVGREMPLFSGGYRLGVGQRFGGVDRSRTVSPFVGAYRSTLPLCC